MNQTEDLQGDGDRPLVSVLITNHNYDLFIEEAIHSVQAQTYGEWELIVCDDGSTDGSVDILRGFESDPRIRLLTQENRGQSAALNAAAGVAKGQILCLLDADDVFLPGKVRKIVECFATTGAGLVMHRVNAVDREGNVIQPLPLSSSLPTGDIRGAVIRRGGRFTVAPTSAVSLSREAAASVFPIPTRLKRASDGFIFLLLALTGPVASIDEILALYRIHGANVGSARSVDSGTATRTLENLEIVTEEVNDRLEQLGSADRLDLRRNLMWQQQTLHLRLLGEMPASERRRATFRFLAEVRRDDLLSGPVRAGYHVIYSLVAFLPRRLRARWLSVAFGMNRAKAIAERTLRQR